MPTALLKFVQGSTIGNPGQALFGTVSGGDVTCSSAGDNSGVERCVFTVVDSPEFSGVAPGVLQDTSGGGLILDVSLSIDLEDGYTIQLDLYDGAGNIYTDVRQFGIKRPNGLYIPSFCRDPEAMNFAENLNFDDSALGWSRVLGRWLDRYEPKQFTANLTGAATVHADTLTGNPAGFLMRTAFGIINGAGGTLVLPNSLGATPANGQEALCFVETGGSGHVTIHGGDWTVSGGDVVIANVTGNFALLRFVESLWVPIASLGVGGGGGVSLQENGAGVGGDPHTTINVTGIGATASDGGGGVGTINVPGLPTNTGTATTSFVAAGATTVISSVASLPTSGSAFLILGNISLVAQAGLTSLTIHIETSPDNITFTSAAALRVGGVPTVGLAGSAELAIALSTMVPAETGHATTYVRISSFGLGNSVTYDNGWTFYMIGGIT